MYILRTLDQCDLSKMYAHDVHHEQDQCTCPVEGPGRVHDTIHQQAQLLSKLHGVHDPDHADCPQDADDPQELGGEASFRIRVRHLHGLLHYLHQDENKVENIPLPAPHVEITQAVDNQAKEELKDEEDQKSDVKHPEHHRWCQEHVPCHVVCLPSNVQGAAEYHRHRQHLEASTADEALYFVNWTVFCIELVGLRARNMGRRGTHDRPLRWVGRALGLAGGGLRHAVGSFLLCLLWHTRMRRHGRHRLLSRRIAHRGALQDINLIRGICALRIIRHWSRGGRARAAAFLLVPIPRAR
mmetsp:Transcript_135239/g.342210  ORF Transcript_135239/g.342210 Transcript_135239/m.342210 type:complete len:298 (-) Transcript_135239:160-1053(-)